MATTRRSTGRARKRKYGLAATRLVERELRRKKRGTLRSGKGGQGGKVKSRTQRSLSRSRGRARPAPRSFNLVILVTPRALQAMAADGVFFPSLARLHPVHRTPTAAIVLQAGWAIALTLSGTFGQLVDYVAFADWIFFGLTVAGLFVYRARDCEAGRVSGGFLVPGFPWTPALFVAATLYVVVSSVLANLRNAAVGVLLLGLGIPVYTYWRRRSRRAAG